MHDSILNEVVDFNGIKVVCRPCSADKDIAMCIIGSGPIVSDEYHIRDLAKSGEVFVDVGAYGGHAAMLATSLGMTAVAIEPLPENLRNIRDNIALNKMNIEIIEGAIGCDRVIWNNNYTSFNTKHRFIGNGVGICDKEGDELIVVQIDLDVALNKFERIHILKTDCEGGEWAIAKAKKTLAKTKYIVGEFHTTDHRTFDDFRDAFPGFRDVGSDKPGLLRIFTFVNKELA